MKFKKFTLSLCSILCVFLLSNCAKDPSEASFKKRALDNSGAPRAGYKEIDVDSSYATVPASEIVKYLKPVYITETPDEINANPEKIKNTSSAENNQKTESVIPGLRDLKDYKTVYKTERQDVPKATERVVSPEFTSTTTNEEGEEIPDHSFYIEDWGPLSTVVSENRFPTFYVVFSKPVKALTSLDQSPSTTSKVMKITPPLKGTFIWYGTQHLSFEASEAADPSIEYTITIDPNLKSNSGDKIQGQTTFTTKAEPLSLKRVWPGFTKNENYSYNQYVGVTPPNENKMLIRFNYQVSSSKVRDNLIVRVNNKKVRFQITPVYEEYFRWDYTHVANKELGKTNTFSITIRDPVPHDAYVEVNLKDGYYSDKHTYYTLKPFKINNISQWAGYPDKEGRYSLEVSFSQLPNRNTLLNNIKISIPGFRLKDENLVLSGTYLTIKGLPLTLDENYTISFSEKIKDIYGQSLIDTENSVAARHSFKIRPISGYVRYLDSGSRILEAQFPHKLLFEYMNADGHYTLSNTLNPLDTSYNWRNDEESFFVEGRDYGIKKTYFETNVRNRRNFEEVDLNPYLSKDGYGFVRFYATGTYDSYYSYNDSRSTNTNHMTVQVTDLGVTARNAINKSVLLVTKLSTGKPVPNAKVYLHLSQNTSLPYSDYKSNAFASGTTDKNGLCVLNYSSSQVADYISKLKNRNGYYVNTYVYVESGNDKVIFSPYSHSSWREGVSTSSVSYVNNVEQRTFMFTDRGLYKPGETVTFRGIDRNQALGTLKTVDGMNYTIRCEGSWYDSSEIISPMYGTTSENGGFYGSFKIPDGTEPGTYIIKYYREGYKDYFTTSFTVAYFEKVRSQASITAGSDKFFANDTIAAKLNASYLAGGTLSNASYSLNWYIQQTRFNPRTPETKDFTFGSRRWYGDREYWSDSYGNLDSSGNANVSCSTKPQQGGDPYIYRAEASVTDVSNQRIYTSSSFLVHPATYYAGLRRAGKAGGYPKINTKVTFDYVLVDTDGNKLNAKQIKDQVSNLEYSINLHTWRVVHEQSVDDTVYTRYEEVEENVQEGELDTKLNQFSFTPKKCGWYSVYITGYDENRKEVKTLYEFYATGGTSYWYDRYNSQSINITPDKNEYNPGETAQLLLESSLPSGDYLITVEREGIFTEEVRHFDSPSNVIDVKIASNYVPVIYVSVSSYSVRSGKPTHEYGETDLDKPKGYYGVAPIFVNPYVRAFSVKVESDKNIYKPGETAKITLTATKNGKPLEGAELTAMAVDRGVLDLIDYHVPDPISYFYSRYNFPLSVTGGDSRANIMDPVTYSIKNLQGGDAEGTKDQERKDFRPTAFFEPALITDKNGKVTCTFKMPDNLTTYRVTAFGVKDDLFALQEKEIQAQNPVNVQQVQPRRMRERDTAECGVLITNLQDKPITVTVSMEANTPVKDTFQDIQEGRKTVPGKAFVDGPAKHKVYVGAGDSSVVYFDVAAEKAGTVELVYTIKSDVLNEKLVTPIVIEKTYVYDTVALFGQTTDAPKTKVVEELAIPGFAKDGRGDLTFTLDATRLGILSSSVNYLFGYPYGCMEQQSSRVLPLVLFGDYIDVFNMTMDSKISNVKKCVTSFTQKWGDVQHANGGFPYWPDDSRKENFYVSLRLAYIYAAAKQRGYTDNELGYDINKLVKYLKANIDKQEGDSYMQAYYCFVLKMLGDDSCELLLSKLNKTRNSLTISEEALVGLAYNFGKASSSKKIGKEIADHLRAYLQPVERSVTVSHKQKNRNWYWYNDKTQELALLLQLYAQINPNDKMVDRLLYTLLMEQKAGYWQSTTTTAHVLDSIYSYIKARNLDNTNYTATVSLNGKEAVKESFKGVNAKPKVLKLPFEDELVKNLPKDKIIPVTFAKDGTGYLFYTLLMNYALPDEMQNKRDEGLTVDYTITDYYTGEIINKENGRNSVITLEDGRTYKATIRLSSKRDRYYVALRCPVPSGAEILDKKFVTLPSRSPEDYYDSESYYYDDYYSYVNYSNQTILDNEVQFFWDSFYSGSKTVSFTFRATRRGVYPTPPVQSECMYESEVFGRSDGYLVQIK